MLPFFFIYIDKSNPDCRRRFIAAHRRLWFLTIKTGIVMPRLAKHLSAHRERPFASLRVTKLYRCGLVNFIIGQSLSDYFINTHYRALGGAGHTPPTGSKAVRTQRAVASSGAVAISLAS